jgi:hypothetical protein
MNVLQPQKHCQGCPWLGAQRIDERRLYRLSTDFPHTFTFERFVEEVRGFVERNDLPPDLSRKILWDIRKGCTVSNDEMRPCSDQNLRGGIQPDLDALQSHGSFGG